MSSAIWVPQEKQKLALASPADELFYGGARGGGKTDFLIADFTRGIEHGEDYHGILFRRTFPQLEEVVKRSRQIYPALGGTYNKTERTWHFPSGSTLKLRFLESDADVENYQGHQYQWIGFDELPLWGSDYCYIYMMGTLRSAAGIPTSIRSSGNPGGIGHLWVKARFIDPMPPMQMYHDPKSRTSRMFIPARLEDNPILMNNDPKYSMMLENLPDKLYRAHRLGDWDAIEGGVFEEWDRNKHVVRPFSISPHWYRFASLDWGYSKPFSCGFYAVGGEGEIVRFFEHYGWNGKPNQGCRKTAPEVARELFAEAVMYGIKDLVCDPSMFAKHGMTSEKEKVASIADHFKQAGFRVYPAQNDRINGLQIVHDYFSAQRSDGKPLFTVFENNTHLIRTLPTLVYDRHNPEDIDTEQEDHLYDELRYALTSKLVNNKASEPLPIGAPRTDYDVLRLGEDYDPLRF